MKTNLDKYFKTNANFEKDGIWFEISEEVGFLIRRFGGKNAEKVKLAIAKYHKPYARQIEKGTLDPGKENKIMVRAFVESCLVNWKGIEIDGEATEFSIEKAVEFFVGLPDLASELVAYASDIDNYKEELGNS